MRTNAMSRNSRSKPALRVSLRAVAAEMDLLNDDWTAYINRRTGELVTVTDEAARAVEDGADDHIPEWQAELLPKIREVLGSRDYLPLPSKFDINEYRILERFCHGVTDPVVRRDLLQAIQGKGAFGRFKTLAQHCGLLDEWHAYRYEALESIAAEWLEANGIGYTREPAAKGHDDANPLQRVHSRVTPLAGEAQASRHAAHR